ncbi:SDR family oxidoreductase [Pectobacterium cacticida]|uniref:SDR family oxidoreductase n=1 Tax=Pectobacterium cacticida TaxID=69221 RepID=A0ABZ2GCS2_9GAMM|nr:SDR family oxidoreductase [Pectobacterium cacticida]UYX06178.1 SDR family oxidoreductase [Pectobacterium cacticida]
MKLTNNTILITGGGSGIGEALAHRFHDLGNTVIIAGRRREALEQAIAGRPNMHAMTFDVEDADGIALFAEAVLAAHPQLNVLINNAGVMLSEPLDRQRDLTDAEMTITTNLLGPIRLTNALIDHLTRQNDATIVNVSSGLAFVPLIASPTYSATKAAIHSYTIALREALRGKVEVIELAPPGVQTQLTPGQESNSTFLPLNDFADEVMTLFACEPTPPEILVERVGFLRFAEAENRFDETLVTLNGLNRAVEASSGSVQ